jgi:hypothetical protein
MLVNRVILLRDFVDFSRNFFAHEKLFKNVSRVGLVCLVTLSRPRRFASCNACEQDIVFTIPKTVIHSNGASHHTNGIPSHLLVKNAPAEFTVTYLLQKHMSFSCLGTALDQAAYHGRLNVLRAIVDSTTIPLDLFAHPMVNACMKNHVSVVKWLHEDQGLPLTKACWIAFEYGARDTTNYIHEQKCPFDPNSIAQACCYGRLEMIQWLWNHRKTDMLKHPNDVARGIDFAASRSNRTLITWLHSRGFSGHEPIWHAKLYKQPEAFITWLRSCGYKQ